MLQEVNNSTKLNNVTPPRSKKLKESILALQYLLGENQELVESQREELVSSVMERAHKPLTNARAWDKVKEFLTAALTSFGSDSYPKRVTDVPRDILDIDDQLFFSRLGHIADSWPILVEYAAQAVEWARKHFQDTVKKEAKILQGKIMSLQRRQCVEQIKYKVDGEKKRQMDQLRVTLLEVLKSSSAVVPTGR